MHTAEHFRQELWFPQLLDRDYYQAWLDGGARSTEDRCVTEARRIMSEHEAPPVSDELDSALSAIVEASRRQGT
jgi:trimethylamine--corrinoid protein Co-methyltransferase